MKNNTMNTALAAFFAFVSAVVYITLYMLELLPGAALIANLGIFISLIILIVTAFTLTKQYSKNGASLYNTFNCYGKWLIWASVICLCLSVLLLIITTTNTMLFTALLFFVIFFWKFMIILWALFLSGALPCYRYTQQSCSNSTL